MSNSLNLIGSLANDRHAERYDHASHARLTLTETRALESTRHRAGWLLVGLGMRLIAGGHKAAAQRARLIGQ